jgi:hypothetical protein
VAGNVLSRQPWLRHVLSRHHLELIEANGATAHIPS